MRRIGVVVIALLGATAASAQTTTCNQYGRTTYCDTTQPPDYSGMQEGMRQLGTAIGTAARERADRKRAEKQSALQMACLADGSPLVQAATRFYDCAGREAVRLEPSGEPASVIAEAAQMACVADRGVVRVELAKCQLLEAMTAADDAARQRSLRAVVELRAVQHQPAE